MAVQMGVTIGGGAWLGNYLDNRYQNEKPIWTIVLSLFGIGVALYMVISGVKKMNQKNDK